MANTDEIRWKQRYDSFEQALEVLTNACQRETLNELERTGLIKTFEICFELSWKVLKDLLFYEGFDKTTPRSILRKSFDVEYIDETDCEVLLDALDKRNLLIHTYTRALVEEVESHIEQSYLPVLQKIHLTLSTKRTL